MPERLIKTPEYKALIHYLCNLEYTGEVYRGRKLDYFDMLDRYIDKMMERTAKK